MFLILHLYKCSRKNSIIAHISYSVVANISPTAYIRVVNNISPATYNNVVDSVSLTAHISVGDISLTVYTIVGDIISLFCTYQCSR